MRLTDFEDVFAGPLEKIAGGGWEITRSPDYLCYIALATLSIRYVFETFPDATRVDFLVERSEKTTENVREFHDYLRDMLGIHESVKLIGDIAAEGKASIPLQAADTLCWYGQRAKAGLLKRRDEQRRFWMIAKRQGYPHVHTSADLRELSQHLQARAIEEKLKQGKVTIAR